MTQITIDNIAYDLESFSDDAKGQLGSLQFVDAEIGRLQAQLAVLQTARIAYARALSRDLPNAAESVISSGSADTAPAAVAEPPKASEAPRKSSFFKKSSKNR